MKVISGLFAFLFLFAAWVQGNDPDPVRWIVAYLVAAGLSGAAALGRIAVVPSAVAALGFGIWFLTLAPTLWGAEPAAFTSFHMQAESHEEPREAVGLLLCAGWCAVLAMWAHRSEAGRERRSSET